jgi:DNA-binding beta-propeller fold protein YncE
MTLQSSRRVSRSILVGLVFPTLAMGVLAPSAFADGTRTWEQSKFEDLTKGTATGVAIRSAGGLELAPSFKLLYATPSTYIWAVASDDAGNVYAATGSPARVYRITPDGQASIIFEPRELQVQTLEVGPGGVIYAATAPDGKVYKIEHKAKEKGESPKADSKTEGKSDKEAPKDPAKPALDSSWSSSEYFAPGTKYIWDLLLDKAGNLYVATGDRGEIYKVTPKGEHALFFKSDDTHIRVLALDASYTESLPRAKDSCCTARPRKRSPRSRSIAKATSTRLAWAKSGRVR